MIVVAAGDDRRTAASDTDQHDSRNMSNTRGEQYCSRNETGAVTVTVTVTVTATVMAAMIA